MTNALFLSSRWIDLATMSASSVQGTLAANNVQTYRPDQVWRAIGCAAEWIQWDFGSAIDVEAVVFLAHNLGSAALVRVRLASSVAALTTSPSVDTGFVSPWPNASGMPTDPDWPSWFSLLTGFTLTEAGLELLEAEGGEPLEDEIGGVIEIEGEEVIPTTLNRYGRLDIVDPTNPDGYVQIGRLYAGPAFVPSTNVDINPSLGLVSPGEVVVTPFGRTFTDDRGPPSRMITLPISALDENELTDELFELQRYVGNALDFAFCLDPARTTNFHKFAMQARFDQLQAAQAQPFWNDSGRQVWQTVLTLAEVL